LLARGVMSSRAVIDPDPDLAEEIASAVRNGGGRRAPLDLSQRPSIFLTISLSKKHNACHRK
jgi:hypothetical protein